MKRRTERIANLIRSSVAEVILAKLSDPRIDPATTSITRVEVPEDLLSAKVFISVIGTPAEQKRTVDALRHAAGHIQELMMRGVRLRHTPLLTFHVDKRFKNTLDTLTLIDKAMREIKDREGESAAAPDGSEDG